MVVFSLKFLQSVVDEKLQQTIRGNRVILFQDDDYEDGTKIRGTRWAPYAIVLNGVTWGAPYK